MPVYLCTNVENGLLADPLGKVAVYKRQNAFSDKDDNKEEDDALKPVQVSRNNVVVYRNLNELWTQRAQNAAASTSIKASATSLCRASDKKQSGERVFHPGRVVFFLRRL